MRPAAPVRVAEAAWEDYWAATRAVELTGPVTALAGGLACRHALTGASRARSSCRLIVEPRDEAAQGGAFA